MATVNIGVTTGTISAPRDLPTSADGTTFNNTLAPTSGNTAALSGDLDAVQGVAWSANSFEAMNQVVGIFANAWACAPRAAIDRMLRMLRDMQNAPNPLPTGG